MRTTLKLLTFITIAVFGVSHAYAADVCATAANVVQNCGFETGNLSGWTVSGTDSAAANNGIYYGVENLNQYSGSNAAYFGPLGGEMMLSQTLSNLIVSDVYTVSLELFNDTTPDTGYINNFSITLGDRTTLPITQVAAGNYTLYKFVLSADSVNPVFSFTSRNDSGFWNLDSIQVIQTGTPEPPAAALCGTVLALMGGYCFALRRRRSSALPVL